MLNPQLSQHLELFDLPDEDANNGCNHQTNEYQQTINSSASISSGHSRTLFFVPTLCMMWLALCVGVLAVLVPIIQWEDVRFGGWLTICAGGCGMVGVFVATPKAVPWDCLHQVRKALAAILQRQSTASHATAATAESRLCTCRLLGSIGAPTLRSSSTASAENVVDDDSSLIRLIPKSAAEIRIIEQVARVHVEWIQTVDRVMTVLRHTASIQLGLGIHSQSVGRVERASLGRLHRAQTVQRNQKTGSSLALSSSLSLATIRERLFQSMQNHNHMLLRLLCTPTAVDARSYEANLNQGQVVVTLSLLQTMKYESLEIISHVMDDLYAKQAMHTPDHLGKMETLCQSARETCAYYSSWLGCTTLDNVITEPLGSYDTVKKQIFQMHNELNYLGSMLTGCHEMLLSCDDVALLDKQQFQRYWCELKERFASLHSLIDMTDNGLTQASVDSVDTESSNGLDNAVNNEGTHDNPRVESGEYEAGDPLSTDFASNHSASSQESKVFVYAGQGHGTTKVPVGRFTKNSALARRTRESELPALCANTEYQLMEELNKRLRAMPQVEEQVVAIPLQRNIGDQALESYIGDTDDSCEDTKSVPDLNDDFPPRQGDMAISFLAELTKSIPAVQTEDE